ncbi:hypothetical protein AB0C96_38980 [Streptomyces sp. NPDC048506]|uniref:hypothetical protein n=1 Tax=Streptomyces sp. NPDC048506 TaxID=3155028 RepID=UPI00343EF9CB
MNVSNNISPGVQFHGTVIQAGQVGGTRVSSIDTTRMAAKLAQKLDQEGPLLALTTAGQAEAAIRLLALVAEDHPPLASVADRLAEDLQARLDVHQ